jgi:hypothetical protein
MHGLDNSTLLESKRFTEIPQFIRNFLIQREGSRFLIADIVQDFAAGCSRSENEPTRQATFIGFNDNYFLMSYKKGSIGLMGKIVILKFKKNRIIDFWSGNGNLDLDTKLKITNFLKENENKYWGLNTNMIYI